MKIIDSVGVSINVNNIIKITNFQRSFFMFDSTQSICEIKNVYHCFLI